MSIILLYTIILLISFNIGLLVSRLNTSAFLSFLLKAMYISGMIGYAIFLVVVTLTRYSNYHSELIDLAYYYSAVQQMTTGHVPHIWDIPSRLVWGDHIEPILFVFIPLLKVINSPLLLFSVQVIWVISGIIPLYLTTKKIIHSETITLALGTAYLTFSGLQMGYAYGFHPIVLLPPYLFWLWYTFVSKKYFWYYLCVLLCLMVKEEVAFIVMAIGCYEILAYRRFKTGLTTIFYGLGWYLLCFHVLFPLFNPGIGFGHWGQYSQFGGGIGPLLFQAVLHPAQLIQTLYTPTDKIIMLFHTFSPISWIPFIHPLSLLLMLPSLLEKLLSHNIARLNGFHYSAALAGTMLLAAIESIRQMRNNYRFLSIFIMSSALGSLILFSYTPLSLTHVQYELTPPPADITALNQVINSIPQDATITASYQIAAHMNRPYGKVLPVPQSNEEAEFVLVDTKLPSPLASREQIVSYLVDLVENKHYSQIQIDNPDIILLHRD